MNATSRAILQTLLSSDDSLSAQEKQAIKRIMDGVIEPPSTAHHSTETILLTQKQAAKLLSVSRVTIWRLVKEGFLNPTELLPGTLRYSFAEVAELARSGTAKQCAVLAGGNAA